MPDRLYLRLIAVAACGLTTMALAGCGIVSGVKTTRTVHIEVTTGFGATVVKTATLPSTSGTLGALALTRRFFTVTAAGRTVESIAGQAAHGQTRWTLYVNGIDSSGPNVAIHSGDHIWWDLHDKSGASDVPAVVGDYPEPFTNGSGGRTFPTVLTCAGGFSQACDRVTRDLDRVGIKVSYQGLGTGSGSDSLAILVGTFAQLRGVIASELLADGPSKSGVYAQFGGATGSVLEIDNSGGQTAQTPSGSYGLIAATEEVGFSEPVWLITGTDRAGVNAAVKAFTPAALKNHFAVAVAPGGRIIPLPLS